MKEKNNDNPMDKIGVNGRWVTPEEALLHLATESDEVLFSIYYEAVSSDFRNVPNSIKHYVVQVGDMLKDRIDNHSVQLLTNLFDK